ncbi:helix-turn-helix transcriptional regulator [Porphyromonas loveana]|uniref:helix-turn-helix transcriptional regulator n=1 Tax=Porphyromonas loveana TaxID=1884669 RepID=UPI0035A061A3
MSIQHSEPSCPTQSPVSSAVNHHPAVALTDLPVILTIDPECDLEIWTQDCYALLFHIGGHPATLSGAADTDNPHLTESNTILLAPNLRILLRVGAGQTKIICFYFRPTIHLCMGICPASGNKKECTKEDESRQVSTLQRLPILDDWVTSVLNYLSDTPFSLEIFELKLRELFFIFRSKYCNAEIEKFLSSFHCRNIGFRAFVFRHHLECRTVEELAAKMQLSMSSFKRHFYQEFGRAPLTWMHEEKAKHIYTDLCNPKLSLQEIAEKYLFSSVSYLCAFCRKTLGNTPSKLRKELTEQSE